jgi:ribosomal protein L11 methyltransferase
MDWCQLVLEAGDQDPERLSEFFLEQGALSVTFEDAADQPIYEPDPGQTPLWTRTRVVALFPAGQDLAGLRQALASSFGEPALDRLRQQALPDQDWERAWMADFRPMRFGQRLWVCPSGMDVPEPEGAVVLDLDPGVAFGTGTHPTTALCLSWLDQHPPVDRRVLDYGCGSGILAIAALKLGAAEVWGTDIDDQALWASEQNALRNGVRDRLHLTRPEALRLAPVDLLMANILVNPLLDLAQTLTDSVRPGGDLLLSGILAEQSALIVDAYGAGFRLSKPREREGWICIHGVRKG